jgi:hypothetical protein
MNIANATQRYEAWLRKHIRLIQPDLVKKHKEMKAAPFPFLRATYYRWAQVWAQVCPELAEAPVALAVGDLHVENFGTWRDPEARLVWGINDFDEAWRMPYTNDLLRLAASMLIAGPRCDHKAGLQAIVDGYTEAVAAGGKPFVLAEHHHALREMATARLHEAAKFWEKLMTLPESNDRLPAGARKAIARLMPERGLEWRISHRVAGLGSLGRERYVAVAQYHGGVIAREAKALAPSAAAWAEGVEGGILYQKILDAAVRARDPFVRLQKKWIGRRLAPDCSRIELSALPAERDEMRLLHGMGWETANVHLGTVKPRVLAADLKKRSRGWLYRAAKKMEKAVLADYEEFRR